MSGGDDGPGHPVSAEVVHAFFRGECDVVALAHELRAPWRWHHPGSRQLLWKGAGTEYCLAPADLIELCNAVERGDLSGESLEALAFGVLASDDFTWPESPEGDRVAETIYDWSSPEINYPITPLTAAKWRLRLLTGQDTFTRADADPRWR